MTKLKGKFVYPCGENGAYSNTFHLKLSTQSPLLREQGHKELELLLET